MRHVTSALVVIWLAGWLIGCGSGTNGTPDDPPEGGTTVSTGTMEIDVAAAVSFRMIPLKSAAGSDVVLTAMWGSRITRLAELRVGQIAFSSERGGNRDIYVMNADGSGEVRLTNDAYPDDDPAYSPNGRKIAFESWRGGNLDIYTMNWNGTGVLRLTNDPAPDYAPAWSPDGEKIVFASARDSNFEIYAMDADGSDQTRLTNNGATDDDPAWSPDGRKIAFASQRDGGPAEIYVMNANGSSPQRLTDAPGTNKYPQWSPDGQMIVFSSGRTGFGDIYTMNADGSRQARRTSDSEYDTYPSYSADGNQILFCAGRDASFLSIYRMDVSGANETPVGRLQDGWYPAANPAATVDRVLIGAPGTDGGYNPPFGTPRVFSVIGKASGQGIISAATVTLATGVNPASLVAANVDYGGGSLSALKLTAGGILKVLEDLGRGKPPSIWELGSNPAPGAIIIFFAGDTGRIDSIIAVTEESLTAQAPGVGSAQTNGERIALSGEFTAAYDARDPRRNHVTGRAGQIVLDDRTGEVLAAQ